MGTSNFHNKNASRIFSVLMSCTEIDEETGEEIEYSPKEWECDDLVGNIRSELKSKLDGKEFSVYNEDGWNDNGLRSFDARNISSVRKHKSYKTGYKNESAEIGFSIECVMRNGYYDGANLDYEVNIDIDGTSFDYNESDIEDCMHHVSYFRVRKARRTAKIVQRRLNKAIGMIERVYADHSEPLVVSARFSNGETWYQKAN